MVWKPFQQVLSDWQCCSSPCFVADINNRPRGIGTPAGKWLQAACSHQDFTWMRLEEERRAKPSGWYFVRLAFPYQSDPAGSCHPFLLWGLHGIVCPGGSAVATSSAAFLEVRENIAPKLQCWGVATGLLTHLCLKEQQRLLVSRSRSQQLLWSPAGWWYIDKSETMLKCNSGVGLKFN